MAPWVTMLLLAAQAAATPPGQWRVLSSNQDSVISLDEASVTRNGDSARARIRAVLAEPYNGIHSTIGELETDCRTQMVRTMAVSFFDRNGRLINRTTHDDPPLNVAGTSDFYIHEAVCRLALTR